MPRKKSTPRQRRPPSNGAPRCEHNRFDRTLKLIAEREPAGMLAWLVDVLGLPPTSLVQASRSKELVPSEQEVDVLWLVETAGEQELLHLEYQLKEEAGKMGLRIAAYGLQLFERDQVPVHSIVLYLKRQVVAEPPFIIRTGSREWVRCEYDVLKLWEVAPETVLKRPTPWLWPLAGLLAGLTPTSLLAVAEQILAAGLTRGEQQELIGMLVVLAGIQLKEHEIKEALRRNPVIDEIFETSSIAQAWRAEGERKVTRILLEARFGTLSEDLLQALSTADEATLTAMAAHPTESLDEVRARLGLK